MSLKSVPQKNKQKRYIARHYRRRRHFRETYLTDLDLDLFRGLDNFNQRKLWGALYANDSLWADIGKLAELRQEQENLSNNITKQLRKIRRHCISGK